MKQVHCDSSFLPAAIAALLLFVACLSGCKHEPEAKISPAQVHEIAQEMAQAVSGITRRAGQIESRLRFSEAHSGSADQLYITLPAGSSEQSRIETIARLIQSMDRVATTHQFTRDPGAVTGAVVRLDYRREGIRAISVHIITPLPVGAAASFRPDQHGGTARLAIILDDLGSDRAAADAIFALPYTLTISVLPNHAHSIDIAEDAHRRGYEVMLHLPMQSVGEETPEAEEFHPGMIPESIPVLFDEMLRSVPYAAGVNNHQGSQATANAAFMEELMPVLRQRDLFYVDSRTTAATVAYTTAQKFGVRTAFRNVPFLDDVAEVSAVRKQLELALRDARTKGEAVAIGHPHPATLLALGEVLPQAQEEGVRLVFASDLVH